MSVLSIINFNMQMYAYADDRLIIAHCCSDRNHHVDVKSYDRKTSHAHADNMMEARFVSALVGLLLAAAVRGTALMCPEPVSKKYIFAWNTRIGVKHFKATLDFAHRQA